MGHLFDSWNVVAKRLRAAPHVLLFLDFDGTLAKITARPSMTRLASATRSSLSRLARHRRVRVCVVSGRDRATLRNLISVPRVRYLGLYGWESGRNSRLDAPTRNALATAREEIAARVPDGGVWVEDKRLAFAVHYRGASPAAVRRARRIVRSVVTPTGPLRVLPAKKAWDVVPAGFAGKGDAVMREIAMLPPGLPIYAGDDHADECAFNAIRRGISIHVGSRRSCAQFRLRDPDEVRQFLERLEEELQ